MSKPQISNELEIFDMLSTLLATIASGQLILQSIREVLTSNPLFNPMALFRYINRNNHILTRKHISQFLQENSALYTDQQIKILFQCNGLKDKMQYSDFLNYIFPTSSGVIRQISTVHFKRYPQTEKLPLHQDVLAAFLLLVTEEIQQINKLEVQKMDSLPKINKQKFRKLLKSIKKANQKQYAPGQIKENAITSLQLRNFMKAFVQIGDHEFLYLTRRLGIDKSGQITIEKLQFWLKPWKKHEKSFQGTPYKQIRKNEQNFQQFNEQYYRESLMKQMSQSITASQEKFRNKVPKRQENNHENEILSHHVSVFKQFVQRFIETNRQIERLKYKFNSELKVNLMTIFKKIDVNERGTIKAQDINKFYTSLNGIQSNVDFQLLIKKFSQTDDRELSYSQFCQIFVNHDQQYDFGQTADNYISQESYRIIGQIILLNLQSQHQLFKIIHNFKKNDAKILFNEINKEQNGFINYQQLKKFINNTLNMKLTMQELMMVLKRLDKSKNGVVVESQFLGYFDIGGFYG